LFLHEDKKIYDSCKVTLLRVNVICEPLKLAGKDLQFVQSLKYLGVFLVSAKHFKCTVDHIKVKFYRVFNCLYSRNKAAHSELVTVELIKSYCLPLILYTVTYATEVMPLSATNVRVLENCINRALYKIFWYW